MEKKNQEQNIYKKAEKKNDSTMYRACSLLDWSNAQTDIISSI